MRWTRLEVTIPALLLLAMMALPSGDRCRAQDESPAVGEGSPCPFPEVPRLSPADSARVVDLKRQVRALEEEARFAEAIPLAQEILDLRQTHQPAVAGVIWWETHTAVQRLRDMQQFAADNPDQLAKVKEAQQAKRAAEDARQAGDFPAAIEESARLLDLRRHLLGEEHPETISALADLAGNYGRAAADTKAESLSTAMRDLCLRSLGPCHPHTSVAYIGLGHAQFRRGDFSASEQSYRSAVEIKKACYGPDHVQVAQALTPLASALLNLGDFAEAEVHLQTALAMLFRAYGSVHVEIAVALNHLALLYEAMGDLAKAEPYMTEHIELQRKLREGTHWGLVVGITNLASLKMRQGKNAEAEPLFREADAGIRELFGDDHPYVGMGMTNLAACLSNQGKYAEALDLQEELIDVVRASHGEHHPLFAHALANLGITAVKLELYAKADSAHTQALRLRHQILGADHPETIRSHEELSSAKVGLGEFDAAESLLVAAGERYERARSKVGRGTGTAAFVAPPYAFLAAARLFQGKTAGVWEAWERSRCRMLSDAMQEAVDLQLTPELEARRSTLAKELGAAEELVSTRQQAAAQYSSPAVEAKLDEARVSLLDQRAAWAALQDEIAREHPAHGGHTHSLADVQATLDERTALIGWVDREVLVGQYVCWGYVVRNRGPVFWAQVMNTDGHPVTGDEMESVQQLRLSLADPWSELEDLASMAARFDRGRITPLLPALEGVENLIVIPSGAMEAVPLEMLQDDEGTYLGDRFTITYAPAATIHVWLARSMSRSGGDDRSERTVLLLGDPPFHQDHLAAIDDQSLFAAAEGLEPTTVRSALAGDPEALAAMPRLPGTRAEVTALASLTPNATILLGADASEARIEALNDHGELADFDVLHFATHALVDLEAPHRSSLMLARAGLSGPGTSRAAAETSADGLLTAQEIAREWKLEAELVTLSACETGLGQNIGDEGMVGFVHTFLEAGARSLLVSLWQVEDLATSLLMHRFYRNWWEQGATKAAALQEAKRWLRSLTIADVARLRADFGFAATTTRGGSGTDAAAPAAFRPYEHPNFWAGFVLFGEAN